MCHKNPAEAPRSHALTLAHSPYTTLRAYGCSLTSYTSLFFSLPCQRASAPLSGFGGMSHSRNDRGQNRENTVQCGGWKMARILLFSPGRSQSRIIKKSQQHLELLQQQVHFKSYLDPKGKGAPEAGPLSDDLTQSGKPPGVSFPTPESSRWKRSHRLPSSQAERAP